MSELWYRFNVMGEKQFFENRTLIDGIVVPAHLVAFYRNSLPNFLSDINLPFIIDPMTHVWDSNTNMIIKENELKKSYQKYVDILNNPIASKLGTLKLSQLDYTEFELIDFIENILKFQYTLCGFSSLPRSISLRRIRKITKGEIEKRISPNYLIPPYFYFLSPTDVAYELTLRSVNTANDSQYSNLSTIMPCICMNQRILNNSRQREKIISDFSNNKHILLWINSFDEREVDISSLSNFKNLIRGFNELGISIMNLYGTYFSMLLNSYGLNKLSSGIAISHRKEVVSTASGGGAPLRYYEPTLKMEILTYLAFRLYSRHPELFICNCPICEPFKQQIHGVRTIKEREEILAPLFVDKINTWGQVERKALMDWKNTRFHFLHIKKQEQNFINNSSLDNIVNGIKDDYRYLSNLDLTYYNINTIQYLERWSETLI